MGFILKNKPLVIKSAELSATIPNPGRLSQHLPEGDPRSFWSLEVWAEGKWYEDEELCGVEARATVEEIRFPTRQWTDVVG